MSEHEKPSDLARHTKAAIIDRKLGKWRPIGDVVRLAFERAHAQIKAEVDSAKISHARKDRPD